jgi:hypothetical protein
MGAMHNCNNFCRANDVNYCGTTCTQCPAPTANGQATCNGTSCGISCAATYRNCAGTTLCVPTAAPACCTSAECTATPTGTVGVCSNNVCTYPCNTPAYKACGNACIPAAGCCTSSDCPGVCSTCSNNVCVAVKGADDTDSCAGTCDANGACKTKQGQTCQTTSGGCISGTMCSPDGYCCDQACNASCLACDIPGKLGVCTPVASGAPHGNRTSCGSGTCAGSCAGAANGACQYPTGSCGSATCSGTNIIDAGTCGAGTCNAPAARACSGGYVCSSNACKTTCASDADCLSSYFCESGTCHRDAAQVSVGPYHACVLLGDGTAWCWGSNADGALGNGTFADSTTPQQVSGLTGATAVSAGNDFSCAITSGGSMKCWGHNYFGNLGNGAVSLPDADHPAPVAVTGLGGAAISVATGYGHTCVVLSGGAVQCWGDNSSGQLAVSTGTIDKTTTPQTINLASNAATSVSTGGSSFHVCAVLSSGHVRCWGENSSGECGIDPNGPGFPSIVTTPADVGLTGVASVSAGNAFSCAGLSTAVDCWGNDGSMFTPQAVDFLAGSSNVAADSGRGCAILSNGGVECWTGTNSSATTAVTITGFSNATSLSYSSYHALGCVTTARGALYCWADPSTAATEIAPTW